MFCSTRANGIALTWSTTYQKWTGQPITFGSYQESPVFRHGECQKEMDMIDMIKMGNIVKEKSIVVVEFASLQKNINILLLQLKKN